MAESEDRRRILDMLAAGTISVDEAANLLKALGGGQPEASVALSAPRRGGHARLLRISIDENLTEGGEGTGTKVRVNVPIALARFAARFLPKDAGSELKEQGIDIEEILASLGDDLPDGKLVDIDAISDEDGKSNARIVIEVV